MFSIFRWIVLNSCASTTPMKNSTDSLITMYLLWNWKRWVSFTSNRKYKSFPFSSTDIVINALCYKCSVKSVSILCGNEKVSGLWTSFQCTRHPTIVFKRGKLFQTDLKLGSWCYMCILFCFSVSARRDFLWTYNIHR